MGHLLHMAVNGMLLLLGLVAVLVLFYVLVRLSSAAIVRSVVDVLLGRGEGPGLFPRPPRRKHEEREKEDAE